MSKTKTIRIAVFAAIMGLLLALSAWAFTTVTVHAADVDVSSFMLLGFDEPATPASNTLTLIINRHRGENSFALTSVSTEKVTYTKADGTTKQLNVVRYVVKHNKLVPTLEFEFDDNTVEVGDKCEIKNGFTFKDWTGGDWDDTVQSLSKDMTFEFTQDGWVCKEGFADAETAIEVASVGKQEWTYNSGVTVKFGITGASGGHDNVIFDTQAWGECPDIFAYLQSHIEYASTNANNIHSRSVLKADGRINVQAADDSLVAQTGDMLTLKKGMILWKYTGTLGMFGHGQQLINCHPLLVINKDISFVNRGETWQKVTPATSAQFTNTDSEKDLLCVGGTMQLAWSMNEGAVEFTPTFTVEEGKDDILSVSETGLVSGLKEGTATVTAHFVNITATVTLTVHAAPSVTGLVATVQNGSTKNGVKGIVAYKNETLTEERVLSAVQKAHFTFDNGADGADFALTAQNTAVSFDKFSNTAAGTTAVTVTVDGQSCDVPVHVYEVQTVEKINANRVTTWDVYMMLYFADVVGGGENIDIQTLGYSTENIAKYGLQKDMIVLRVPTLGNSSKTYPLSTLGHVTEKQCLVHFDGYDGKNQADSIPVGAVLEIKENFRFYRHIDDSWVEAYKFGEPFAFVWTGSEWKNYTADADGFTLGYTEVTVPCNAEFAPNVTLTPQGSYMDITYVSSDSDVVEVKNGKLVAKAAGTATVTASLGTLQDTQSFTVTVEDKTPEGIVLANERTFYVTQNSELDLSKIRVKVYYGKGSDGSDFYGDEITLSPETATHTLDTSVTGKRTVTLNVSVDSYGTTVTDTVDITVEVPVVQEVYPDNFSCNDDNHLFGAGIAVYFEYTFANLANVWPTDLTEQEAHSITDHISYVREGATVTIDSHRYLTHILVFDPKINGNAITTYQVGDKIILTKGLSFFRWSGAVADTGLPMGEGDYVKVGELKYDVDIIYGSDGKFAWKIAPADGIVLEEKVTVGLNEQHAANTAIVPSYATSGEWTYTVTDTSIATVSTQGLISGKKIGTTHVVAVLKDAAGEVVATREFDIEVADSVASLKITSSKAITLALNADLDVSALIKDYGLKGVTVMASGAEGKEVDLSSARVTGYSADKAGTQTLTFRLTVDGKSVTGTIDITVGESGKKKCGGLLASAGSIFAGGGILAIAVLLAARKRKYAK